MLNLSLTSHPTLADVHTLQDGLRVYNERCFPVAQYHARTELAVVARDNHRRIVGAAIGEVRWGWLYVDTLWVDATQRGKGLGRRVMLSLEQVAHQHGARRAYLMTTSFQARPFYEKLGYTVFAENQNRPCDHVMHYLRKYDLRDSAFDPELEVQKPPHASTVHMIDALFRDDMAEFVPLVHEKLAIFLRDARGTIRGGLYGNTYWDWFDLRDFWLEAGYRGQGYGRTMLEMARAECQRRKAHAMVTEITSFHNLGFYSACGFSVFGEVADRPPGHLTYFIARPVD